MINWKALGQLIYVRMREYSREPEVLFWAFIFPLLLSSGLGIAFRDRAPDKAYAAVIRSDGAPAVVAALRASGFVQAELLDETEARRALRRGKVSLILRLTGGAGGYEYQFDPLRPDGKLARTMVDQVLQQAAGRTDKVPTRDAIFSEPGARYIDFLIPGLIGMNLMSGGMWGVGFTIAEMKVKKLLKRLIATPMRPTDFLLSIMASRLIFMFIEVGTLLIFGALAFGMKIRAPLLEVLAIGGLGALTFGSMGLLVAARAERIESVMGRMNVIMMPMFVFSGVFFSAERFPAATQPLIKALPLTALNDSLRAAINEGTPWAGLAVPLLILAGWGIISFAVAVKRFRWV
ncbi:MAG: ABC transporter permease [Acidobacteria bacterium]|nr:ABC transporter permease [Acidobacteriota bacterium]MBI3654893.1 ABC transporter permease [Acidobacteriota bacterium]